MDKGQRLSPIFWAKSSAGGRAHSLVGHLLDTAAVGEILWDQFFAANFRKRVNEAAGPGRSGRDLFVCLCVLHDIGKATPAFQAKALGSHEALLRGLRDARFTLPLAVGHAMRQWPHPRASVIIARELLAQLGAVNWDWVLPLLEGHHGKYGHAPRKLKPEYLAAHGDQQWRDAQQRLAREVVAEAGIDLGEWELATPTRGVQLALGGFLAMADWIASSDFFAGDTMAGLTMEEARERAAIAWRCLGLVHGWDIDLLMDSAAGFTSRFSVPPRPLQVTVLEAVARMRTPGLVVIEAPMGEGKTEAALAAAELLARGHGCSGLVFAMPTQGTTDAMYTRVREWMTQVDPTVPVSLLHGKAMLNEEWYDQLVCHGVSDIHADEYGMEDTYGARVETTRAPSSWLLGRHRGLLSPVTVATIDQVLWAATRTKFVALRHAGLAGKVVIIDEVHTYDAYMSVFLRELLRWCARLGAPALLMSATLPPSVRQELVGAWCEGAGVPPHAAESAGYPAVLTMERGATFVDHCEQFRPDLAVTVEVLSASPDDLLAVGSAIHREVADGGCALTIMDTVDRARGVWLALKERGVRALLIHGRFTAAERARRTTEALRLMGPAGNRPAEPFVVVATQIAEQSFDVDADVLFTDVAPIDLLLQRIGRLHRHNATKRPDRLRNPRVFVTGLEPSTPEWSKPIGCVYRELPLLATAANLRSPALWSIPSDVPALVAAAYAPAWSGPPEWSDRADKARKEENSVRRDRQQHAQTWRLDADPRTPATTLDNLHYAATAAEEDGRVIVRDGFDEVEVTLVVREGAGLWTLGGRSLGCNGERAADVQIARELLGDSVRIRWFEGLKEVGPLPQWVGLPMLTYQPVIVLDENRTAVVGRRRLHYDDSVGLTVSWL